MLEDQGEMIEIVALTLFFNEKYFGAVKLAVVSFNNMLLHFEDEYKTFYTDKIAKFMMPLLNKMKKDIHKVFLEFEEQASEKALKGFIITKQEMKTEFLPRFRPLLEEKVIKPSFESINLKNLNNQY